jgi:hypothetical protein
MEIVRRDHTPGMERSVLGGTTEASGDIGRTKYLIFYM